MRRKIGIGLVLAAAAWAAAVSTADAKGELIDARLCGQGRCVAVSTSDVRALNAAILRIEQQQVPAGGWWRSSSCPA